jgi:hypothetical protein
MHYVKSMVRELSNSRDGEFKTLNTRNTRTLSQPNLSLRRMQHVYPEKEKSAESPEETQLISRQTRLAI